MIKCQNSIVTVNVHVSICFYQHHIQQSVLVVFLHGKHQDREMRTCKTDSNASLAVSS